MIVVLWIINVLLAIAFGIVGIAKVTRPMPSLVSIGMAWVADTSARMVRAIGGIELAGAVGLIVPKATGVAPGLTPLAAMGLAVIMLGALVVHLKRAESVTAPMILGGLAVASAALGFALV